MKFGALLPGLCFLAADKGKKFPKKLKGLQTGSSKSVLLQLPSRRFDNLYFISAFILTPTGGHL